MKLITNLVEKVGADRLLHFLVTAWIVAEAKQYGLLIMTLVFFIVIVLGLYKELKLDTNADYSDVKWSVYGGLSSYVLLLIEMCVFKLIG